MLTRLLVCAVVTAAVMTPSFSHADETFELILCRQYSDATADGGYRPEHAGAVWPASHTALIVCDVWDAHHCLNAVKRLNEFAPRLNDVVKEARRRGATIIHAPSDCMEAYTIRQENAPSRCHRLPISPTTSPRGARRSQRKKR
jgi:predicted Zn-ribbon and HTH transcriptional regulator